MNASQRAQIPMSPPRGPVRADGAGSTLGNTDLLRAKNGQRASADDTTETLSNQHLIDADGKCPLHDLNVQPSDKSLTVLAFSAVPL